ncbi:hypothetical protein EA187_00875 [Lujinxingia sediminis]|uniref:Uncharacterized protein n=1 Tax=Lujinxingia sediminis TaxID=2480984 RepID=A0ABY0CWN6_9DELT|nr:hypothetical protein [Lujinxingia sediminis]RVU48019.1 hypothetical protein EA187_00875 [Lujinxingia sediminis]
MQLKTTEMVAALVMAGLCACETPRSSEGGEGEAQSAEVDVAGSDREEVVRQAAALRDRAFEVPVTIEEAETLGAARLPEAVETERARLAVGLYGDAEALRLHGDVSRMRASAEFLEEGVRVRQVGQGASSRWAAAVAASRALEKEVFGAMAQAQTVDGWLAREVVLGAGPMFAATLAQAQAQEMKVDAALMARRPDLVERVEGVGPLLRGEGDGLGAAVTREALALGAALYRARGWAGVEWGRVEGAVRSVEVVRPDRWLAGDGVATWQWPEMFEEVQKARRWEEVARGEVGPLLTSVWLEEVLPAHEARSIFGAWLADSYRVYEGPGEAGQALVWLTAWRTPHEARQVAGAMERALLARLGSEARSGRMRVAVQGLNVALTSYERAQDPQILDDEVKALAGAAVAFLPEEPAPMSFVPTTYERYVEAAQDATLEGSTWIDPAAGWQMSLAAFEGWTVQKSDEVHVRWFATHEDGSLVQWTTELVDPSGAVFGGEEYVRRLQQAFASSVVGSSPEVVVSAEDEGPRVLLSAAGEVEGETIELRLWQWERGEVIVSYSVQEPESGFGERLGEAQTVLETLKVHGEALVKASPGAEAEEGSRGGEQSDEAQGILEFRVEE